MASGVVLMVLVVADVIKGDRNNSNKRSYASLDYRKRQREKLKRRNTVIESPQSKKGFSTSVKE